MGIPTTLLFNPTAGRGRSARALPGLITALETEGASVEVRESRSVEHLSELAAECGDLPNERIVACGGDGTIHHILQGLDLERSVLAIAPLGSGNDFANVMGMPRATDELAAVIVHGSTVEVDVGLANGRRFLGVAALGFDALVARYAQDVKLLRGSAIYLYSVLRVLAKFKPWTMRYEIDGEERREPLMLAAVGNTDRYGGGVRIAPGASLFDGQLDTCLVHGCSALELLKMLPFAYFGRHIGSRFVEMVRASTLHFDCDQTLEIFADGELVAETPVAFSIESRKLKTVSGREEGRRVKSEE